MFENKHESIIMLEAKLKKKRNDVYYRQPSASKTKKLTFQKKYHFD